MTARNCNSVEISMAIALLLSLQYLGQELTVFAIVVAKLLNTVESD